MITFDVGLFVRNVGGMLEQLVNQVLEIPALEEGFPADWVRPPTAGIAIVAAERLRQQLVNDYGPAHDGTHDQGELLRMAVNRFNTYQHALPPRGGDPQLLAHMAALVVAEIDSQLRANMIYWCDNCGQLFVLMVDTDAQGVPSLPNGPVVSPALLRRTERNLCPDCAAARQRTLDADQRLLG